MRGLAMLLAALALLTACGRAAPDLDPAPAPEPTQAQMGEGPQMEDLQMQLTVNGRTVTVTWQQNAAVAALEEALAEGPLTVTASPYGGFEVVGPLGRTLPAEDAQTTTAAGDIVLYDSENIVIFHGSNAWAYTRLGHIEGMDAESLRALFGTGDVELVLALP